MSTLLIKEQSRLSHVINLYYSMHFHGPKCQVSNAIAFVASPYHMQEMMNDDQE